MYEITPIIISIIELNNIRLDLTKNRFAKNNTGGINRKTGFIKKLIVNAAVANRKYLS